MQEPHGAKGTLQGLGFAESMVNTFEQSAKFYWRMWGPLGEPMVRTVDAWADMQRSYHAAQLPSMVKGSLRSGG